MEYTIIDNLAQQINRHLQSKSKLTYGLLGGDFGSVCFMYHYSRINNRYENIADCMLDRVLQSARNNPTISTYCNGIAGLGIGLKMLEDEQFVDGVSDSLSDFDRNLYIAAIGQMKTRNIDFLHGLTGIGLYFTMRHEHDGSNSEILAEIVKYLDLIRTDGLDHNNNPTVKWILAEKDHDKSINISMSHGMSSIGILLSRILQQHLSPEIDRIIVRLLVGIKNYILAQRIDPLIYGSWFPSFPAEVSSKITGSRLGWCYGDLGIGIALIKIAEAIADTGLREWSVDMLRWNATERRQLSKSYIFDAEMCHGASGVGLIYRYLHTLTGEQAFIDAADYWRDMILNRFAYKSGNYMTFPTYNSLNHTHTIEMSILSGIAGIGMFLMHQDAFLNKVLLLA